MQCGRWVRRSYCTLQGHGGVSDDLVPQTPGALNDYGPDQLGRGDTNGTGCGCVLDNLDLSGVVSGVERAFAGGRAS